MEDVAVFIFRVIIIVALIIGAVKRAKRQRSSGGDTASGHIPTEAPQMPAPHCETASAQPARNIVPEPTSARPRKIRQSPATAKQVVIEAVPMPQRKTTVEANPDDAEAMAAEYYRTRSAYKPAVSQAAMVSEQSTSEATSAAGTTEKEDIMERFNLRDAVLYSEILRPKFDE